MCECGNSNYGKYFSKIGGQLGDRLESKVNSFADAAKKRFKDWTGLGDYKIVYNSLIHGSENSSNMKVAYSDRGLIVKHKEYLGDVITSSGSIGAFNSKKYTVNPGNIITFPWLNPISLQYDQYKPLGIIFEFVSTASETSTSASLGSVIMSTNYDVTDPDPLNKADMLNRAYSSETKMSQNMLHGLECDPLELQTNLYYCSAYKTTNLDPREFDMANFYVATQGGSLPVNTIVGSLYVHYEYEFFKQIPYGGIPSKSLIYAEYSGTFSGASLNQYQNWWTSNVPTLVYGKDLGIASFGTTLYIPTYWQGATFLVTFLLENNTTTSASVAASGSTLTGCSVKTAQGAPAGYWSALPRNTGSTTTSFVFQVLLTITSNINTTAEFAYSGAIGNFPASAPAGGSTLRMQWLLVPNNYNSLS